MKNCIAVLNLGGVWHSKAKISYLAAAERWGCEIFEVTQPLKKGVHAYWQKAMVWQSALEKYDRCLQLDADMLIRNDCPNPFDLVPAGHFGVVSALQIGFGPDFATNRNQSNRLWSGLQKIDAAPDDRHLNAGFILYDRELKRWLMQWLAYGQAANYQPKALPEQSCLSNMLWHFRDECSQTWLPHGFNRIAAQTSWNTELLHSGGGPMRDWVYHFTGSHGRQKIEERLQPCWWNPNHQVPGRVTEVVRRLKRGGSYTEIGVHEGQMSRAVLDRVANLTADLVDVWGSTEGSSYEKSGDAKARFTNWTQWVVMSRAHTNIRNYADRVRLLQLDSVEAAKVVDDESRDLVFLDGDHSRECVVRDIIAWWPKVKVGGWLGGHDYGLETKEWKFGVKAAVDSFAEREGLKLELGQDMTWFVRKPSDG